MSRNTFHLGKEALFIPGLLTFVRELRLALEDCRTVLDAGCGNCSPLRFLSGVHLTGLDGYPPALEEARRRGTHDEYMTGDVLQLEELLRGRQFDACVALDVIEHLHKEAGWRMLTAMETLAKRRVVILTPNGFLPQRRQGDDLQEHLSGWTADEMRTRGYRVLGIAGLKGLRGEYHQLKYKPRLFWAVVSMLSQVFYTRSRPERAAAIFCIKDIAQR